jgi:hypothetical protein
MPVENPQETCDFILGENLTDISLVTYISFASDLEVISQEFFLYDANAIIASVGGGLGMFLGASCLGIILQGPLT